MRLKILTYFKKRVVKQATDVKFMLRYKQEETKASSWTFSSPTGNAHLYTCLHNFCILNSSDV